MKDKVRNHLIKYWPPAWGSLQNVLPNPTEHEAILRDVSAWRPPEALSVAPCALILTVEHGTHRGNHFTGLIPCDASTVKLLEREISQHIGKTLDQIGDFEVDI